MIQVLLAVVLLVLAILLTIRQRWEYSDFVKTADLIPGPKRNLILGNMLSFPRNTDGKRSKGIGVNILNLFSPF